MGLVQKEIENARLVEKKAKVSLQPEPMKKNENQTKPFPMTCRRIRRK